MRLQHDTFTCQKCNATLNATSGEVNVPDTSEVVAIYTMCEYCGAIYQGTTSLQEARAGAKIGWTYLPDDQVSPRLGVWRCETPISRSSGSQARVSAGPIR